MKATVYTALAAAVALVLLATPIKALAHDGWRHDHGRHWGWYKHQGDNGYGGYGYGGYGYGGGYPGYWHHRHHDWDDDDDGGWHEHHGWGGYGSGAGYGGNGYSGYPISVPGSSGYYGQPYYGGSYGSTFAPNTRKMMQLQQTMNQRLSTNQALYQAAMAQGNYKLANKLAGQMQKQSMTLNAANSMLGGAMPGNPYQPAYGNPYYGQPAASPVGSILQMFGY